MAAVIIPYRPEVLEARSQGWLGRVSLSQPLSRWVLTAVAVAIALALLALLVVGTHARRVVLDGELVPLEGPAAPLSAAARGDGSALSGRTRDPGAVIPTGTTPDGAGSDEPAVTIDELDRLLGRLASLDARLAPLQRRGSPSAAETRALRDEVARVRGQLARLIASSPAGAPASAGRASSVEGVTTSQPGLDGDGLPRLPESVASLAGWNSGGGGEAAPGVPGLHLADGEATSALHRSGPPAAPALERLQARLQLPRGASGVLAVGHRIRLHYPDLHPRGGASQEVQVVHVADDAAGTRGSAAARPEGSVVFLALPEQTLGVEGRAVPLRAGMRVRASVELERRRLYQWLLGSKGKDRALGDASVAARTAGPAEPGREESR